MKTKHQKQKEALQRNEYWASLSYNEQLKQLAKRPGKCAKQIARIKKKM